MLFSKGLYYPQVDISNTDWLRSNILLWDKIYTIVPRSIAEPYHNDEVKYLADEGIIKPYKVDSNEISDLRIRDVFVELLSSPRFDTHGSINQSLYREKAYDGFVDDLDRLLGEN